MPSDETVSFIFRDPVSACTHLLWCALGIYLTGLLWRLSRGDRLRQFSSGVFGLSIVLLYGASGIYHAVPRERHEQLVHNLQRLDHSAIYVLIAGTYTPAFAILLHGRTRWVLLGIIWALAGVGIAAKWLLPWPPYWLTVSLYVAMGWLAIFAVGPLLRAVGVRGFLWVLCGGLLYTFGAVCDATKWPNLLPGVIGSHEVLHVADMAATFVHVCFIIRYVLPFER